MAVFGGGERDFLAGLARAGLLAASLSLPLSWSRTLASARVLSASEGENLLPLLDSTRLDGGGLGLSICVGL